MAKRFLTLLETLLIPDHSVLHERLAQLVVDDVSPEISSLVTIIGEMPQTGYPLARPYRGTPQRYVHMQHAEFPC